MPQNSHSYQVIRSENTRTQLKEWGEVARELGLLDQYVASLKAIERKMQTEPLSWGDPVYPLSSLKLIIYRGIYWPFVVHYGVNEGKRLVFVKEYDLLPNNPFQAE
jgi:hypothetical protein